MANRKSIMILFCWLSICLSVAPASRAQNCHSNVFSCLMLALISLSHPRLTSCPRSNAQREDQQKQKVIFTGALRREPLCCKKCCTSLARSTTANSLLSTNTTSSLPVCCFCFLLIYLFKRYKHVKPVNTHKHTSVSNSIKGQMPLTSWLKGWFGCFR